MGVRANPADALGDLLSVERIPALQEYLKAAKHLRHALRIGDDSVFNGGVDIEMPLDAGHRAEINLHNRIPLQAKVVWAANGCIVFLVILVCWILSSAHAVYGYHRIYRVFLSRD